MYLPLPIYWKKLMLKEKKRNRCPTIYRSVYPKEMLKQGRKFSHVIDLLQNNTKFLTKIMENWKVELTANPSREGNSKRQLSARLEQGYLSWQWCYSIIVSGKVQEDTNLQNHSKR